MSTNKPAKVVFGTGSVGDTLTGDDLKKTLDLFHKHGHVELDTAATYPINNFGASEKALAQQDLSWASLSTKISAMRERANSLENVRDSLATSEKQLGGKEIDILYFHMPDAVTPLEEQAAAMDEAYRAGKFKRFGISNFAPQQIEELMEIVERKGEFYWASQWQHKLTPTGYVKPSVLQGQYNLFARKGEEELLPVLRKHGIAYYAYS
jgi:aflatoxin B1 aldehyde reductase